MKQKFSVGDSGGSLERAFSWLGSDDIFNVMYAALELRFTFEKIHIKHAFASSDYSTSFGKLTWKPEKLKAALDNEFSQIIDLEKAHLFFLEGINHEKIVMGYFLPIPDYLYIQYGKLDNFLHAQWAIPIGWPDRRWQKSKAKELELFANELIPHSNPLNSLDNFNIPNIQVSDLDTLEVNALLRQFWK